jgi:hypothetical protein
MRSACIDWWRRVTGTCDDAESTPTDRFLTCHFWGLSRPVLRVSDKACRDLADRPLDLICRTRCTLAPFSACCTAQLGRFGTRTVQASCPLPGMSGAQGPTRWQPPAPETAPKSQCGLGEMWDYAQRTLVVQMNHNTCICPTRRLGKSVSKAKDAENERKHRSR